MKIKMIVVLTILVGLLVIACQKPVTSEPKKVDQAQTSRTENKEVPQPEQQKTSQPAKNPVQELSPLERARGKEIKDENGLPIVTWGSLKDLPTLDEVFPVVDKLPEGVQFPRGTEQVELPVTAERKQLMKNVKDEMSDKLYAIKSPNGQCIIELYGGTPQKGKREDWLRSIAPKTKEVLWKYDEPGLESLDATIDFGLEADSFILSNIYDNAKKGWPVKLFSCRTGYLRDIYFAPEASLPPPSPMGWILPDGRNILITTNKGKVINYDNLVKNILWEHQINPYVGYLGPLSISPDNLYFATCYRRLSGIPTVDKIIQEGFPEELQVIEVGTGNSVMKKKFNADLGDISMHPNTIEIRGVISRGYIGIWVMDGIGYLSFLEKRPDARNNPYGNVALLFIRDDALAFRIQSLGFTFTNDGRYLAANGKYYDMKSMLNGGELK